MSADRFWGRGRHRRGDDQSMPWDELAKLTITGGCDRCGARACVRVLLPSCLELLFCAHHHRQHASALAEIAVEIHETPIALTPA